MSNERLIRQAREMAPTHYDYSHRQIEDILTKLAAALEETDPNIEVIKLTPAIAPDIGGNHRTTGAGPGSGSDQQYDGGNSATVEFGSSESERIGLDGEDLSERGEGSW